MMNGRLICKLTVLAVMAAPFLVSSCSEKAPSRIYYFYNLKTLSAVGISPADEVNLEYKVDSINTEYHKLTLVASSDELCIKHFEMLRDTVGHIVEKNIFDKIQASRLELSFGLYHIEDKYAKSPLSELIFIK